MDQNDASSFFLLTAIVTKTNRFDFNYIINYGSYLCFGNNVPVVFVTTKID